MYPHSTPIAMGALAEEEECTAAVGEPRSGGIWLPCAILHRAGRYNIAIHFFVKIIYIRTTLN